VRHAIRAGHKIALSYRDEQDRLSERTVWPFAVGYHETVRLMITWCELRRDFRSFRTDRVTAAEFLEDRYPERPATLRARWRKLMNEKMAEMHARDGAPALPAGSPE
jgi:predicted DNA-binding transcriptional regulator YafY